MHTLLDATKLQLTKNVNSIFLPSVVSGWLQKIKINPQVYCSAKSTARNELVTSFGCTLQQIPATKNMCPPLQETDTSCSGVMILKKCDIVVQR